MKLKTFPICFLWSVVCMAMMTISLCLSPAHGATPVSSGMNLPRFELDASEAGEVEQYLGLENTKFFTISQVPFKIIIIEIFSFYCPICHRQAPIANKLYKFIQQDPELSKDIKMIGIGAGNNQRETNAYKTKFRVPFPLFSDPHFDVHKKIGEPRTPFTIVVTSRGKILLTHFGVIEDIDQFLSQIRKFHSQE